MYVKYLAECLIYNGLSININYCLLLLLFYCYWAVVGIKLSVLHMLGKCSTTELYPQPFIAIIVTIKEKYYYLGQITE
jgi:hypothetical protein